MTTLNSKIAKAGLGLIAAASMLIGASAMAYTFTAPSLQVGSTGPAVMALQQALNASSTPIQVSAGSAGSPGHESSYFGPATAAAVVAFQAAHGITATAPVVGPQTRAILNSMTSGSTMSSVPGCAAGAMFSATTGASCSTGMMTSMVPGCTSTAGFSTTTGMSCAGSTTATQTGSLTAMLSTDNPASGYIIGGQATADLAHFTFNGTGTLNSVTLTRTGISDQNTLSNVYLYNGATRLTDGYSFNNNSTLTMNNLGITIGGSMNISVKGDVATGNLASTLGVSLTSFTNGTTVNAVNIAGNQMYYGTGSLATANISALASTFSPALNATVNAGTSAFDVWQSTIQVGIRSIALKGANFRLVGSAPANALANVGLYIDGVSAGSMATMGSIGGTTYAMFNFTSAPVTLTTGSHTLEVRADINGGASYTVQVSLQQAADLVLFDPQVGVNIAATTSGTAFSSDNANTLMINGGSAAVVVDPSFQSLTSITGGATNTDIAKFQIHGYGEDVKVQTLTVLPVFSNSPTLASGTCSTGGSPVYCTLNNVTLYFNGQQVGSQQPWDGHSTIPFNLGSQMIVPAGVNSTLEVRADLQNSSSVNYTGGSLGANLVAGTTNAQGQSSHTTLSFPLGTSIGTVLNIQTGQLSVSKNTAYNNQTLNPNLAGQKIGSFTLQNQSSSESVRVTSLKVDIANATPTITSAVPTTGSGVTWTLSSSAGLAIGQTVMPSTVVGGGTSVMTITSVPTTTTIVGNIVCTGTCTSVTSGTTLVGSGTTVLAGLTNFLNLRTSETSGSGATPIQPAATNAFSTNFTLLPGATKTIDVIADLSAANAGNVIVSLTPTSIGVSSNVSIPPVTVAGQTITFGQGTFNAPTFTSSSSTQGQFVTGGTTTGVTDITKATFNFTATNGAATINKLKLAVAGIGATSVKVAGLSAPVSNGVAYITGLSIPVANGGTGAYVDVWTSYSPVGSTGVASGSLSAVAVKSVEYTIGGVTSTLTSTEETGSTYTSGGTFTALGSTGSMLVSATAGYVVGDVVFFGGAAGTSNIASGHVTVVTDGTHFTANIDNPTTVAPTGGSTIYHYTKSAPVMNLVASKPIVTVATTNNAGLVLGGQNHIMDVTLSADAGGNIGLGQLKFNLTGSNTASDITFATPILFLGTTALSASVVSCSGTSVVTCTFTGTTGYPLQASTPVTLSLYDTVSGTPGAAGTSSVTASLTPLTTTGALLWTDVAGNSSTAVTAATSNIYLYNYPTQTWSTHN